MGIKKDLPLLVVGLDEGKGNVKECKDTRFLLSGYSALM
jgi:hypothetical protein